MVELKLIAWDKYEAVYSWKGMHVIGREFSSDEFRWHFPEIDHRKAMLNNIDTSFVMHKYEIPIFNETYKDYFEKTAKKELEEELDKLLKEELNQQILIQMLFDNIIIIGDK